MKNLYRASTLKRPYFENMPPELTNRSNWLLWRDEKGRKVPYQAGMPTRKASSTKPTTWDSFGAVKAAYDHERDAGVGFALHDNGIAVIDIDDNTESYAVDLLRDVGCQYIEVSPSGRGLHGWGLFDGELPRNVGQHNGINVEIYKTGRYMSVTGNSLISGPFKYLDGLADLSAGLQAPTQETKDTQDTQDTHVIPCVSCVGKDYLQQFIPKTTGGRNKYLFALARYLKGLMPNASREELRAIVADWHKLALPIIGTKNFSVSWGDFMRGWERVKYPHGAVMDDLLKGVNDDPLPDGIPDDYGNKALLMVRICRRLQDNAGSKPFYIGARTAGDLLDMHFTDAAALLRGLMADGVIERVSKGAGSKASEYMMRS